MSEVKVSAKLDHSEFLRVARTIAWACAIALLIPVSGCNREEDRVQEEMDMKFAEEEAVAAAERRPLDENESVVAEFAADGLWHPLPYSVHSGQALQIETFGATKNYGDNLVEFRIAGRVMMVTNGNPFIISQSGPLDVRVRYERGMAIGPSAQIQITRLK